MVDLGFVPAPTHFKQCVCTKYMLKTHAKRHESCPKTGMLNIFISWLGISMLNLCPLVGVAPGGQVGNPVQIHLASSVFFLFQRCGPQNIPNF